MYRSVFILHMPTPQSSSSPIGVKGCVHFLDGHFLCHSNFIFRMSMLQIELLLDLD